MPRIVSSLVLGLGILGTTHCAGDLAEPSANADGRAGGISTGTGVSGAGSSTGGGASSSSTTTSFDATAEAASGSDAPSTREGGTAGGGASADGSRPDDARSDVAAPEDARSDAASSDGSGSWGCPGPALVCDDFETDLSAWKVLETGGAFAIDATHAYGGKSSVKLTIPANQRGGFLEKTGAPLFPLVNDTNWGRMMVYFESMASLHFDNIRAAPIGGGTPWYNLGGQYKKILFNYYSGNNDCAGYPVPNPTIATNQWTCWEWKFDGSKNEMDLWLDGTLVWSVVDKGTTCVTGGTPSWAAPTFGTIRLGEYNAQTEGSQTRLWMDDVALGTSGRIGCPALPPGAH